MGETMLKQMITNIVNNAQGIMGVDVAVRAVVEIDENAFGPEGIDIDGTSINEALEQLVKAGEIVEIEYTLPSMPDKIKSFYLPKGTRIDVICWEQGSRSMNLHPLHE